jgi:hypothetical protein
MKHNRACGYGVNLVKSNPNMTPKQLYNACRDYDQMAWLATVMVDRLTPRGKTPDLKADKLYAWLYEIECNAWDAGHEAMRKYEGNKYPHSPQAVEFSQIAEAKYFRKYCPWSKIEKLWNMK